MPRQEDTREVRFVIAPPPQQVTQFLREHPVHPWAERDIGNALSDVPADRWNRISPYLLSIWSKISSVHIRTLSSMPIERLDAVLSFVNAHHITNEYTLRALSVITAADLNDFQTFLQSNRIMQQKSFPLIFAHMPKDRWSAFVAFMHRHQFDENIMAFGMVYAKHPEENWEILFHSVVKEENDRHYVSDYVMHKLKDMSPEDSMAYLTFLKTHQVMDWEAKNNLIDMPADKRERVWSFVTLHNLVSKIHHLSTISDAQWDVVTRFILKYPETPIDSLAKLPVEQWDAFERFVSQHQMTDGEWIGEFAEVPDDMRENLLIYRQEYNPNTYEFYRLTKIRADLWPQFMATIKHHGITNPGVIERFAAADPNEWEELASFIVQKNINDGGVVRALVEAPETRYRALLAFVEQFNIHDQHIIEGLVLIPNVQQWENMIRFAEPLFRPPLCQEERGAILLAVYNITKREYRVDREMPVYNEAERQGRIAYALEEIANGRMPQDPGDYGCRLQQILATPLNRRLNMHQAAQAGATAIDVHAEGRDDSTTIAMRLFKQLPYDLTQVHDDYEAFIAYVNVFPNTFIKTCTQMVLGLQSQKRADSFGPISADKIITSHGLDMTGREFFARLWHFIHHGDFIGIVSDDALKAERENARVALVQNLADAYEEDHVICNPGKIQRIVVGVLQGRLQGVHVDKEVPVALEPSSQTPLSPQQEKTIIQNTVHSSLRDFLQTYEPKVKTKQALKAHVKEWLQNERGLDGRQLEAYRHQFQAELNNYLTTLSDLPEENEILENSPQKFNAKKEQIQGNFLRYLQELDENINKKPSTAKLCKKFNKDLRAAQDEFFKNLTINTLPEELEQTIQRFRNTCKAHITAADKIMGHGSLYRIMEITIKAILGLFAMVGMILGAVVGRGVLSHFDRQAFKQTFFALNETSEQKALHNFEGQILDEDGLLSIKSFQTA